MIEVAVASLAWTGGGARLSGMLAFLVCFLCHQSLLFAIGRWSVELDAWRGIATTLTGVAGLAIGSALLPAVFAAPLIGAVLAFIVMLYVYEMDWGQRVVAAGGWYLFGLGSLVLAGILYGPPESATPSDLPPTKEEIIEVLRRSQDRTSENPSPEDSTLSPEE